MPAIRYLHNCVGIIVTPTDSGKIGCVTIRLHGGKITRLPWLGFMCRAGTKAMPEGAFSKMEAMEVTSGDGSAGSDWIKVSENQFVLCWRVIHVSGGMSRWAVYGLIDENLCPIVMNEKNPRTLKQTARVYFLGDKGLPSNQN